ncbi:hypothetical protein GKZ68_20950 (plasmid) [Hymenobacter sp. BRD128]|uniref:hypothetical protein n=1 Tax=Hymenobacter sp. BRD128 TaxID=2675878 RepID=UPI001563FF3D|nr:hypothetical protein [Hymenobacter sp. BRD128]QKG59151.1 hypothetical protein GKZ68_20950 [Hymenobacter sp. BRD128]
MPTPPLSRNKEPRAAYDYDLTADYILVVTDLGAPRSVTNDIQHVLADIAQAEELPSLAGYRAVYQDSQGEWAGITLTAQGDFTGFYGLGRRVTELYEALARVRDLHPRL